MAASYTPVRGQAMQKEIVAIRGQLTRIAGRLDRQGRN